MQQYLTFSLVVQCAMYPMYPNKVVSKLCITTKCPLENFLETLFLCLSANVVYMIPPKIPPNRKPMVSSPKMDRYLMNCRSHLLTHPLQIHLDWVAVSKGWVRSLKEAQAGQEDLYRVRLEYTHSDIQVLFHFFIYFISFQMTKPLPDFYLLYLNCKILFLCFLFFDCLSPIITRAARFFYNSSHSFENSVFLM